MSDLLLFELGRLEVHRVSALCDACLRVRSGVRLTGEHGSVTMCLACLVDISGRPMISIQVRPDA